MSYIDKQALRISELEELNELLREKVKKLESDLWDKEQLRQVYSEKSFNLDSKVRELEARNQKDFVWRGNEISRLNDEVDELKEKLEAAEQANKLAQEATEKLVQERIALAAENTALKKSEVEFNEYCRRECEDVGDTWEDDFTETPATDAFLAEVRAQAHKEGAYFVANRMLAAWDAGFIDDTAKNAADIARMILTSTEFMADAPEGDFDRSFADGVLEGIAAQLRKGVQS
ncbi:Eae protein [Salmonella enterica]|nr:Eae protein [Salmonella enterica]